MVVGAILVRKGFSERAVTLKGEVNGVALNDGVKARRY